MKVKFLQNAMGFEAGEVVYIDAEKAMELVDLGVVELLPEIKTEAPKKVKK